MTDDLTHEEIAAYRPFRHYWRTLRQDDAISGLRITVIVERGFFGMRLQCLRSEASVWLVTRTAYRRRLLELGPYRNV